ncbi:TetR/AcrR family transcriptional regulator [Mycolicibacterium murale]|uniref:TetR/AcrR family transcriptional regulator n=1 Tax=Mycolicibacterium murale TaxID=182220 RepID=UPI001875436F|nr:TetR family transcriptional regulator [Mycolicibacterium murale]MCV7184846.1 TetR family transcriptional regulator [Mycolicibacterium murale]
MPPARLSKELLVETAVAILDADGADALTFRALAARLSTGSGAIYWHVANKNDLLAAATQDVIGRTLGDVHAAGDPRDTVRAIASAVFDAIDAHPWVGAQLAQEPWQPAMVQIFERVGRQIQAMGVAEESQFNSAAALIGFILGLAAQYASALRLRAPEPDRSTFLKTVAAQWISNDPLDYPFVHQIAGRFPDHDDREQFLAGVDLILRGIAG